MKIEPLNLDYSSNKNGSTDYGEVILFRHRIHGSGIVKKDNWQRFLDSGQKFGLSPLDQVLRYGGKFKIVGYATEE